MYGEYVRCLTSINSFPFAILLEVRAQNMILHVEFLHCQRRWNCRMVLAVRVGLWKADLELVWLNAIPAKCHTIYREVFPRPTSGILHRPTGVWLFLLSRFWSVSITYEETFEASWKSLKICQDKYLRKWWYRVFILYLIYNAFTLTYFLTRENEE